MKLITKYTFFFLLLVVFNSLSFAYTLKITPAKITKEQLQQTMEGKTILKELKLPKGKENGKMFRAVTMIDASIDEIYNLISDFKQYPSFMPDMDQIIMLESHENSAKVTFLLGLPFGISKKYRIQSDFENKGTSAYLRWKKFPWKGLKEKETIKDTEGYWYLVPHPLDNNKTLVKYIVYSDPGKVPFGAGWVVDYMTKKSLPNVFSETKKKLLSSHK